jgi:hypothetical protein
MYSEPVTGIIITPNKSAHIWVTFIKNNLTFAPDIAISPKQGITPNNPVTMWIGLNQSYLLRNIKFNFIEGCRLPPFSTNYDYDSRYIKNLQIIQGGPDYPAQLTFDVITAVADGSEWVKKCSSYETENSYHFYPDCKNYCNDNLCHVLAINYTVTFSNCNLVSATARLIINPNLTTQSHLNINNSSNVKNNKHKFQDLSINNKHKKNKH